MSSRRTLWIAALICAASHSAPAADYPAKPVRIIVPFSPGAGADAMTHVLAKKLTEYWGKQVLLDNRPGIPGVQVAANAPADGYTLLLGAGSHLVTAPLVMVKKPYDPQQDFAPASLFVTISPILVTHPSLDVKTVKDLIALAKRNPGQLNYISNGMGSSNHLAMELFEVLTGARMVHVPYKGAAPSITDMIAGYVQLGFISIPSGLHHVKSGKLKALAVSGTKRALALPSLPTISESAVPGFEYTLWDGVFVPEKTPTAIVSKISTDVQRALKEADVVRQLVAQGVEPAPSTPAELARYLKEDTERWARIVKERNIRLE